MLSKEARFMLQTAKAASEKKIGYLDFTKRMNWDYDRIKSAGNQLIANGLATEKYHSPIPGNPVLWGIVLTEEGRNSRKYFWIRITNFLFKSIAVPIIVAFFTALITAYVTTKIISG